VRRRFGPGMSQGRRGRRSIQRTVWDDTFDDARLADLPFAFTDPGCDSEDHVTQVLGAAVLWQHDPDNRPTVPFVLECGCLCWLGSAAEAKAAGR
jgi:hypothetical protein